MLRLFKSTTIAYVSLFLIGFFPCIRWWAPFVYVSMREFPPFVAFVVSVASFYVYVWIISRICLRMAKKKYDKILDILYENCAAAEFIRAYTPLYKKKNTRIMRSALAHTLAGAYMIQGNFGMAKQLFDAYPPVPNRRAWAIHAAYYSANLILYYLQGKDFPAAQRELQRMEEAMKSPKLRKKYREEAEKIFAERRMFVQVHMGNYDGAEEVYLREVREAKDLLAAVSASCLLVKIYAATGEPAKAAERYAFVRDKGGDTRYAEEARQYLAQAIPE